MYELLKKDGRAKRGVLHTVHGDDTDTGVYECRYGRGDQGSGFHRGSARDQRHRWSCPIPIIFM